MEVDQENQWASDAMPADRPAFSRFLLAMVALVGPQLWTWTAFDQHMDALLQEPSLTHPLGTDEFGRDILAMELELQPVAEKLIIFLILAAHFQVPAGDVNPAGQGQGLMRYFKNREVLVNVVGERPLGGDLDVHTVFLRPGGRMTTSVGDGE